MVIVSARYSWCIADWVSVVGCSAQSRSRPSSPAPVVPARHVVVLGDSLAVSPSRADGFPAELQRRLDTQNPGWTVSNAGVSGDTAAGGLRRFDQVVPDGTRI